MKNTKKAKKKRTFDMIRKAVKNRDFEAEIAKSLAAKEESVEADVGVPYLTEPTEHDIKDELVRMDSFAFRDLNE